MERLCYRCNAPVAAGVPFCPQCNAPQIRVAAGAEHAHDIAADAVALPPLASATGAAFVVQWSAGLARTAVAAVATVALLQLISIATGSPALSFLALPLGGWFAVYLYSRRMPGLVSVGMGARLGAVTGFFIFIILICISAVGLVVDKQQMFDMMQKAMKDAAAANPNPQATVMIQQLSTPSGMMTILFLAAILFLFASLILCSIGGAAGAAMQNRSRS